MRIVSRSMLAAALPVVLSTLLSGCVVYDDPYTPYYAPPAPIRFETYDPTPYYYHYYRYYDRPRWGGGGGWCAHGYYRGHR